MKREAKSGPAQLVELVLVVAVAIGLALGIQAFLVKPYRIPSESMVPTLEVGQRVLVNRFGNNFGDPKIGDILVFHPPAGAEEENTCGNPDQKAGAACDKPTENKAKVNYIKRVVAVGGDTVSIRDGHAIVNGKRQKDGFTRPCGDGSGCDFPRTIKIPADHFFMMGDNRGESDDSRFWGPVPRKWVIGGAFATYWPPKRINLF